MLWPCLKEENTAGSVSCHGIDNTGNQGQLILQHYQNLPVPPMSWEWISTTAQSPWLCSWLGKPHGSVVLGKDNAQDDTQEHPTWPQPHFQTTDNTRCSSRIKNNPIICLITQLSSSRYQGVLFKDTLAMPWRAKADQTWRSCFFQIA